MNPPSNELTAIKVYQWLPEWEHVEFDEKQRRRRPDPHLYLFTMPAFQLKALTGIHRRTTSERSPGYIDTGIQRAHEEERSLEILEFIRWGYPWSSMTYGQKRSGRWNDLRKPGWLPTAIVVNILNREHQDTRRGRRVADDDYVVISDNGNGTSRVRLPTGFSGQEWQPSELYPMEVIDGQHRLWAFESTVVSEDYQLPVVAFYGLDISWQAYLFWTINIKPKRINASLAFDLYPLLRTEDWLERFEGPQVYRESRAQELTQTLWAHPHSPWYQHINMLGERGLPSMVRQAAWIRSLVATYIKLFEGPGVRIGGLFGAKFGHDEEVLHWDGAQQAAFLIVMGQLVRDAIANCDETWAEVLREAEDQADSQNGRGKDPAFYGHYSLLNTDQGIRGLLSVTNDLSYVEADTLGLTQWAAADSPGAVDETAVTENITGLYQQPVVEFLTEIAQELSAFDWRTSSAPDLSENQRLLKAAFRGSGGYREIRRQLLLHLASCNGLIGTAADYVVDALGYDHE